jgi:hypothetical protein
VIARQRVWRTALLAMAIIAGAAKAEDDPEVRKWRAQCPEFSQWEKQRQPTRTQISKINAIDRRHLKAINIIMTEYGTPTADLINFIPRGRDLWPMR